MSLALLTPANSLAAAGPWRYTLRPDSYLLDDCPSCGRPSIPAPLRGTFDLRLLSDDPLFSHYALENISFTAASVAGRSYKVVGKGTYTIGGEVALLQNLSLEVSIDDGVTNRPCFFTNAAPKVERLWPMLQLSGVQTDGTFTQVYQLSLSAAPFREIWFSSANGLTPGNGQPSPKQLSGGDLLSSAGRVVKSNRELTQFLGLMPSPDPLDLGLEALDVLPGGEIVFSIRQDAFSETLGPLQHGDLLSSRGRIVKRNQDLVRAFGAMPPSPDLGLDAVQVADTGEVLFSTTKDFFSEALGRSIRRGDLLSDLGRVVKRNEELVARFQPADPKADFGLDAFRVWPSGEIWFSVETSFQGPHFESYNRGDLLSDQGYVVYRNLELVGSFKPLEDLADFGLDSLFIVSDAMSPDSAPRFTSVKLGSATGQIALEWKGSGRAWQVFRAMSPLAPWLPVTEILPDSSFTDPTGTANTLFFRVLQW